MARGLDDRYSRQVLFPPIGEAGQRRIRAARVLLLGCGGLGAESASLLARAGVGFLRIVDRDVVELSNLQRQALFDEEHVRIGLPKAVAAAHRLATVNSGVEVEPVVADVTPFNILSFLERIDLVIDGFDNFEGRYLLNDACVKQGLPWVYGACVGSSGLSALIVPGMTPCLRCLYRELPEAGVAPTCDTAGILGPVAHVTAALEVAQALRLLVGEEVPRHAVIASLDVWTLRGERVEVPYAPSHGCPCCVEHRFEFLAAAVPPAAALCGRNAVQVRPQTTRRPELAAIADRLRPLGEVSGNEYLVRFRMPPFELTLFADGRAIVKGTGDAAQARSLVARYFSV
jgi:molybdopterin/thiamine biosynthesis adenylyltransferase